MFGLKITTGKLCLIKSWLLLTSQITEMITSMLNKPMGMMLGKKKMLNYLDKTHYC